MIFVFTFIGLMTFIVVRMSISCILWSYPRPVDIQHAFRVYFPYYIIILFAICIAFILKFDKHPIAIYYFSSVYLMALLVWRSEIKKHNNFAVEPNQTQLL